MLLEYVAKPKVLVIDDDEVSIKIIEEILCNEYDIYSFKDASAAYNFLDKKTPDIILADIAMPNFDGFEFCMFLKNNKRIQDIPIIFVTSLSENKFEKKGLKIGASDYIVKPFNSSVLRSRIQNQLAIVSKKKQLNHLLDIKENEIHIVKEALINYMSIIAEYRDDETSAHLKRTELLYSCISKAIMDKYPNKLKDYDISILCKSAKLHDIGKIGIKDEILLSPGILNSLEYAEMKRHTIIGKEIIQKTELFLGKSPFLTAAGEIAELHHEKYDGSGYPHALFGESIPISAQIMCIVDIYDALRSNRPYKKAMAHNHAVEIIAYGDQLTKPEHFSPEILKIFKKINNDLDSIVVGFNNQYFNEQVSF